MTNKVKSNQELAADLQLYVDIAKDETNENGEYIGLSIGETLGAIKSTYRSLVTALIANDIDFESDNADPVLKSVVEEADKMIQKLDQITLDRAPKASDVEEKKRPAMKIETGRTFHTTTEFYNKLTHAIEHVKSAVVERSAKAKTKQALAELAGILLSIDRNTLASLERGANPPYGVSAETALYYYDSYLPIAQDIESNDDSEDWHDAARRVQQASEAIFARLHRRSA